METNNTEVAELLEELYLRFNTPEFIAEDPISIPHMYSSREDREIAGFMSATIAWGNRKAIVKSARRMMEYMDDAPSDFVLHASDAELCKLESYVHRTFNGLDFSDFVLSLRSICERYGGVGRCLKNVLRRVGQWQMSLRFLGVNSSPCHINSAVKNIYLR